MHYTICCYRHLGRITAITDGSIILFFPLNLQVIPPTWLALPPTWLVLITLHSFTCIIFRSIYYHCITVLPLPTSCPLPPLCLPPLWYFVTNTIHSNIYSDEIFRHYRLIKLTPKFPATGAHFSDHNSGEIYFSLLNVIFFFIISDEIHISSLKLYF